MVAEKFQSKWNSHTSGLSAEEIEDLENAKAVIANYEKIYSIFEYSSELTRLCNMVETKVCANNPSLPMNMYRRSGATDIENVFPEIEKCLEAYYNLIDDCNDYPEWQKKIQKELGGTVSYLALALDESSRDAATEVSEAFRRFDAEKQIYFK